MIPELGHFLLIIAAMTALLAPAVVFYGIRRGDDFYAGFSRPASLLTALMLTLSTAALVWAFLTDDFSVAYVANHSNTKLAPAYKAAALWGSHEGSMLLWIWLMAVGTAGAGFVRCADRLFTALLLVLVLGFAVLPLIQAFLPVPYGMGELLSSLCVLVLSGWALGLLFMLAAYWVSLSVRHKAQALALLLVVWFVAVLLYDLGLLVVTVAGADVLGRGTLTALMLANPASVFRLLNQSVIGVLSFEVPSAAVLSGILAAWIAVLFAICARTLAVRRL